jgi:hypothetical protein
VSQPSSPEPPARRGRSHEGLYLVWLMASGRGSDPVLSAASRLRRWPRALPWCPTRRESSAARIGGLSTERCWGELEPGSVRPVHGIRRRRRGDPCSSAPEPSGHGEGPLIQSPSGTSGPSQICAARASCEANPRVLLTRSCGVTVGVRIGTVRPVRHVGTRMHFACQETLGFAILPACLAWVTPSLDRAGARSAAVVTARSRRGVSVSAFLL